jgi:hypothetical protein
MDDQRDARSYAGEEPFCHPVRGLYDVGPQPANHACYRPCERKPFFDLGNNRAEPPIDPSSGREWHAVHDHAPLRVDPLGTFDAGDHMDLAAGVSERVR